MYPEQRCYFVPNLNNSLSSVSNGPHDIIAAPVVAPTQTFILVDGNIHFRAVVENALNALIHRSHTQKYPGHSVCMCYCKLPQLKRRCLSIGNEPGRNSQLCSRVNDRKPYSSHNVVVQGKNYAHRSRFFGSCRGHQFRNDGNVWAPKWMIWLARNKTRVKQLVCFMYDMDHWPWQGPGPWMLKRYHIFTLPVICHASPTEWILSASSVIEKSR